MGKVLYCTNFVIPADSVRVWGQPASGGLYGEAKFFAPLFESREMAESFLSIFSDGEGKIFELKNGFKPIWEE